MWSPSRGDYILARIAHVCIVKTKPYQGTGNMTGNMTIRKLQKHSERESYYITLASELVDQLDWKQGENIDQQIQIGGRDPGHLKLSKVEK